MSKITVLKSPDSIDDRIAILEDLLHSPMATAHQKKNIQQEIKKLRKGHSAEKNAHYHLSKLPLKNDAYLISDLRLSLAQEDGTEDVAQIDHLLVNKFGIIKLFETKSYSTGIKVTEKGQFLLWLGKEKGYKEIPSPIKQSQRHEPTLLKALESLGYHGLKEVRHYILVDYKSKLIKPDGQFANVCRVDQLSEVFEQEKEEELENIKLLKASSVIAKALLTSTAHIEETFRELVKLHQPQVINYEAKFGVQPASHFICLTEIEQKYNLEQTDLYQILFNTGLLSKGRYGVFVNDLGKQEGLVMKKQGDKKMLYLPRRIVEQVF